MNRIFFLVTTMPTQIIKFNQCCSRQISQSDCSIHIKLLQNKSYFRYRPAYADYKHVLSIDSSVDMALQGSSRYVFLMSKVALNTINLT